jgi:hypothetical protein
VDVKEGETGIVTAKLLRNEAIRGRVVQADGSPARGVLVKADGSGHDLDHGSGSARTSGDGTYEMFVAPGEGYAVYVEDPDQAAPARLDVIVREGKPASDVDFTLSSGTIVRGSMTFGPHDRPVPEQFVRIYENGAQAPADLRVPGYQLEHTIQRRSGVMTDKDGRFSIRLGPGTYTVIEPSHRESRELTIQDEPEKVLDYHLDRPLQGLLTGQVTFQGKPVAEAEVEILTADFQGEHRRVRTDDEGRFQVLSLLDKTFVYAKTADGSLAAIVEIGPVDPTVTVELAPTATASGILLDENGKPAANRPLIWGRRVFHNERRSLSSQWFGPRVVTDAQGRFTLPSLVVGQIYDFALARDDDYLRAGRVQPKNSEPIDLGTLKAGAYVPPEEMSPPPAATPPQQSR